MVLQTDLIIYCSVVWSAVQQHTVCSRFLPLFLSAARRNPAGAVERDPAETQTDRQTGNKRIIVVVDTGTAAGERMGTNKAIGYTPWDDVSSKVNPHTIGI
jgi:hypothetical protein